MADKKQEKKKSGAQDKRVRPQGWSELRQASRSVRRLARVLRHNGEDAAKSFAVKHMLDGALNKMLRSPEYARFQQEKSRRRLTYPQRRAQKRAAKREARRLAAEREILNQAAEAAAVVEVAPEKPVNRGRRRTAAAKLKSKPVAKTKPKVKTRVKATAKPKMVAVKGRVRPNPEKAKPSRKE